MIGRIIEQLDGFADRIDHLYHPMQKLRAHAAALWAVVHFELYAADCAPLRGAESLPPCRQRVDNEVTGFGGTTEGHRELSGIFEDSIWDILIRLSEIIVTRLVLPARFPAV